MRKQVFGRQLGRTKNERQALFRGLIRSLVTEGEIKTTVAKAKAIRAQAEKLITKAKSGTLADRRLIFRTLNERVLVNRLVEEIAPLFKERKGGYLRLVRLGRRRGDSAEMMKIMFTESVGKMKPQIKESPKSKPTKVAEVSEVSGEPEAPKEEKSKIVKKTTRRRVKKNDKTD